MTDHTLDPLWARCKACSEWSMRVERNDLSGQWVCYECRVAGDEKRSRRYLAWIEEQHNAWEETRQHGRG